VGRDVPDEVGKLAAEIGVRREPQQLDLSRVDVAVRTFYGRASHSGAEALEGPCEPVVAPALSRELGGIEMLVDRPERLDRVLVRGVVEEVVREEAVLGDAGERVFAP